MKERACWSISCGRIEYRHTGTSSGISKIPIAGRVPIASPIAVSTERQRLLKLVLKNSIATRQMRVRNSPKSNRMFTNRHIEAEIIEKRVRIRVENPKMRIRRIVLRSDRTPMAPEPPERFSDEPITEATVTKKSRTFHADLK